MSSLFQKMSQVAHLKHSDTALVEGEIKLSYAQLWQRIDAYQQILKEQEIKCLGLYIDNSSDWVAIDLAALQLGMPVVAVPHFFSQSQKNHVLRDAGVDALIAPLSSNDSWLAPLSPPQPISDSLAIYSQSLNMHGKQQPLIPVDTAKITYTSGSTGSPKGVCLSAQLLGDTTEALVNALAGLNIESHLSVLPYSTLLENVAGVYLPLFLGASVYSVSTAQLGILPSLQLDPNVFANTYNSIKPNSLILTPQLLQLVCELKANGVIDTKDLQFIAVGGAHCSRLLLNRANDLGLPVYQGYGLSECGSVVSLSAPGANQLGSAGKPLGHVKININKDGEIIVSGNAFGRYLGDDGTFPSQIKTGDIGYLDEQGFLSISGRHKNMLVLSTGRNISPEWVESELLQQQEIAQCLVYGDGRAEVEALIVPSTSSITDAAITQALLLTNLRLPNYAQIGNWTRANPFSSSNGQLTSNGKPVRNRIVMDYYIDRVSEGLKHPVATN